MEAREAISALEGLAQVRKGPLNASSGDLAVVAASAVMPKLGDGPGLVRLTVMSRDTDMGVRALAALLFFPEVTGRIGLVCVECG